MTGNTTREVIKDYMDFLNEIEKQPEDIKGYSAGILEECEQ